MRKVAIIEKIHQDGIDLLKNNPGFEFELIEDSSEENLKKFFQILMHALLEFPN